MEYFLLRHLTEYEISLEAGTERLYLDKKSVNRNYERVFRNKGWRQEKEQMLVNKTGA